MLDYTPPPRAKLLEPSTYSGQLSKARHPADHAEQLRHLLARDEADADDFWAQVSRKPGRPARLRLLFVADHVPDELARVVDFLNEQMRVEDAPRQHRPAWPHGGMSA